MDKKKLYIFLDVDGVLNNTSTFRLNKKTIYSLSYENLVAYQHLIDKLKTKYDVKVILSSTWRMYKEGLNKISKLSKRYSGLILYGKTPNGIDYREVEIKDFCDSHNINYDDILIIDDELIDNELKKRHLRTNCHDGLRFSDVMNWLEKEGIK